MMMLAELLQQKRLHEQILLATVLLYPLALCSLSLFSVFLHHARAAAAATITPIFLQNSISSIIVSTIDQP